MSETIVIKVGGSLAADTNQCAALAADISTLRARGAHVVVVHGGGPQLTATGRRMGIEPKIVAGRRITDAPTLEVATMVLGGSVNLGLSTRLLSCGVAAVGLSGPAGGTISAVRRPPRVVSGGGPDPIDFGFVGDITEIRPQVLTTLLAAGFVPVMNSLGVGEDGQVYNINADVASTRVAAALGARLMLTTGSVRGVQRDKDDPTTRIPVLREAEARGAIADGTIVGGMIPKIEESLAVIRHGVPAVHVIGKIGAGDIVGELDTPGSIGTALLP